MDIGRKTVKELAFFHIRLYYNILAKGIKYNVVQRVKRCVLKELEKIIVPNSFER